ncbi:MAG: T9SS type A sorting domain-containing protein [Candidatus Eisenbacteria bacterium]|nr:T9SS type A sorting domain-containing protein [Candidatus Eisenbacteria bacterium]
MSGIGGRARVFVILLPLLLAPLLRPARAATFPYRENFEVADSLRWEMRGGWHRTAAPETVQVAPAVRESLVTLSEDGWWPAAAEGNACLVAADESTGTYVAPWDPAAQSAGNGGTSLAARRDTAWTPVIFAPPGREVRIRFRTWWEVESVGIGSTDWMYVEFSDDSGAAYTPLATVIGTSYPPSPEDDVPITSGGYGEPGVWEEKVYSCSTGAEGEIRFRFIFDTADPNRNGFRGWFVDDFVVSCEGLYPPYGLTATDTLCGRVRLAWADSSTAAGILYAVARRPAGSGGFVVVADSLPADSLAWSDTSAVEGAAYEYVVRGVNDCGPSGDSAPDSGLAPGTPSPPGSFAATDTACAGVRLTWAAAAGAVGYRVFRNDTLVASPGAAETSWLDESVARGVVHVYRVDAAGLCDTASSAEAAGSRRDLPPAPTAVSATDSFCAAVEVSWDTTAGDVERYVVFRDDDSVGVVARGAMPSFADAGADSMIRHAYSVRAWNACGFSEAAGPDTGMRIGRPPSPASCDATDDRCDETVVTWTASPDTGFVERWVLYRDGDSIGVATGSPLSWSDTNGEPDSLYEYSVRAWNRCGYSAQSAADDGLRGADPPLPALFDASDALCAYVELTWSAVEWEILRYILYRDGDSLGAVAGDAPTVFRDSSVAPMAAATYSLRTRSSCGFSPGSVSDGGMRQGAPPMANSCDASDSLCGRVRVTWTAPTSPGHVERWVVYRDGDSIGVRTTEPYTLTHVAAPSNERALYGVRGWSLCGWSEACEDSGVSLSAPAAPADFTASRDLCRAVELHWNPPATGGPVWTYSLTRTGAGGWTVVLSGDSYEYVDGDAPAEAVYTLRAHNCEESPIVSDTGRTIEAAPSPPSSAAASIASCDSVHLSWSPVVDAGLGYVLFRNGAGPVDSVGPGIIAAGQGSLDSGTDYIYTIFSVNACGRSAEACTAAVRIPGEIAPAPAGACTATRGACAGITVRWNWTSPDIEWYRVVRSKDGHVFADVPAGTDSLLDATIAAGDSSTYTVRAGNRCFVAAAACSARGSRAAPPPAPSQCSASSNRCGTVRVYWYWDPAYIGSELSEFRIYRKQTPSSQPFVKIGAVPPGLGGLDYDDTTPTAGLDYLYRVAAANRCGETYGNCQAIGRAISPPGSTTPTAPPDGATDLETTVLFAWSADAGAVAVRLEVALDPLFDTLLVDSLVTGDEAEVSGFEFYRSYRWRVSGWNNCGPGPASAVRVFSLGVAPGLELIAGATRLPFGNGSDTLFVDSLLVLENRYDRSLGWSVSDPGDWMVFDPPSGVVAAAEKETVRVRPGEYRCGISYRESLFIDTDPVPPGRRPIGFDVSLAPPPRPAGDVDWDCRAEMEDATRLLEALLGVFTPTAEESLGADANGDGRINVSDVVLLGRDLAAGAPAPPAGAGKVEFACVASAEPVIRLTSSFPLRAVRARFRVEEGDPAAALPADPSRTIVAVDGETGSVGVFLFDARGDGACVYDLIRVLPDGEGKTPSLRPEAVEMIGAGGERVSLRLDVAAIRPELPPARLRLNDARPNPFNAYATIEYGLPATGAVRLAVYDLRGARVRTLVEGSREAGAHAVVWNGRDDAGRPVASGVYFLRIEWSGESRVRRLMLIR